MQVTRTHTPDEPTATIPAAPRHFSPQDGVTSRRADVTSSGDKTPHVHRELSWIYLVGIAVLITAHCLWKTMFLYYSVGDFHPMWYVEDVCRIACGVLCLYAVLSGRYRWWELLAAACAILLARHVALTSNYHYILWFTVAVVCAKGVKLDRVALIYVVSSIAVLIFAYVMVKQGLISEQGFFGTTGRMRYALGTAHPNTLGCQVFFTCCAISYLRRNRLGIIDLLIDVAAMVFCYAVPYSRTCVICIGLLACATLAAMIFEAVKGKAPKGSGVLLKAIGVILVCIPLACATFSVLLCKNYDASIPWEAKLNVLMSGRFELGRIAFDMYNAKPFGQVLRLYKAVGGYSRFSLDNCYTRVLLQYGYVTFLAAIAACTLTSIRGIRKGDYWLAVVVAIVCIYCISEAWLLHLAYNIFLIGLLADLGPVVRAKGPESKIG